MSKIFCQPSWQVPPVFPPLYLGENLKFLTLSKRGDVWRSEVSCSNLFPVFIQDLSILHSPKNNEAWQISHILHLSYPYFTYILSVTHTYLTHNTPASYSDLTNILPITYPLQYSYFNHIIPISYPHGIQISPISYPHLIQILPV